MRVRTMSSALQPAPASAPRMISKQRSAFTSGSGSHDPSGHTGAVPDTSTRSPTTRARLNPMVGSNGDPEEICRRRRADESVTLRIMHDPQRWNRLFNFDELGVGHDR